MGMNRQLAALAALILIAALAGSCLGEETEKWVICREKSCVYVRAAPGKKAMIIGRAELGDLVVTDGIRKGKYVHLIGLSMESEDGWIHGGYLVDSEPVKMNGEIYRISSRWVVAVRRTVNGSRRAWAKPGAQLKVYAMSEEWTLTNRGFVMTKYLEADVE